MQQQKNTLQKNGSSTINTKYSPVRRHELAQLVCARIMKNSMMMKWFLKSKAIAFSMADRVVCNFMCPPRPAWKRTKHAPSSAHFQHTAKKMCRREQPMQKRSIRQARCRLWPLAVIGRQLLPRPYSQSKPRNPTVEQKRNSATSHNVTLRIDGRLVRAARGMRKPACLHAK